jgi:methanogenic corrinoid protein MtbC1
MNHQEIIGQISNHIVKDNFEASIQERGSGFGSQPEVSELIHLSMKKNVPPRLISEGALDKAMDVSIKEYLDTDLLLPELIERAKSTSKARDILSEYTDNGSSLSKGKVVLATIDGRDRSHWRGTITSILNGLGFAIIDLGNGVSVDQVVRSVKAEGPELLVITVPSTSVFPEFMTASSVALTPVLQKLTNKLSEEGCRKNVTVMVGGFIAGIESADDIGVDHCCENMLETVDLFNNLYNLYDGSSHTYN